MKRPIKNIIQLRAYLDLSPEVKFRNEIKSFKNSLEKEMSKTLKDKLSKNKKRIKNLD